MSGGIGSTPSRKIYGCRSAACCSLFSLTCASGIAWRPIASIISSLNDERMAGTAVITFARDTRPFRLLKEELMERYGKPVFGVSLLQDENDRTVYAVENSPYNAVFYETPERAVHSFARLVEYRRYRDRSTT